MFRVIAKFALPFAAAMVLSTSTGFSLPLGVVANLENDQSNAWMTEKQRVLAPFAFLLFCKRNPDDCRISAQSKVYLGKWGKAHLRKVNRAVNRQIRPRREKLDVWSANVRSGDCEDYVLTKRQRLIRAGFPASALRIAVARTSFGVGHAVLVVRTFSGDLVLDNRFNAIRSWNRTGLRWIKMQSGHNPKRWVAL